MTAALHFFGNLHWSWQVVVALYGGIALGTFIGFAFAAILSMAKDEP